MPQEIDKRKRSVLVSVAQLAGAGAMIAALTQAEQAYAAVFTAVQFRERRKSVISANPPSYDTQTTIQSISRGEPISVQVTPTPDLQATATELDIRSEELTIQKQQTDNQAAFLQDVIVPIGGFVTVLVGVVTIGATIWKGVTDLAEQRRIQNENQGIAQRTHEDELYQKALDGLGSDKPEARAAAATQLLIFLEQPGYERFYKPIFDVAVTHFREIGVNPKAPLPDYYDVDSLVFVKVFKTAVKSLHDVLHERQMKGEQIDYQNYLDASNINFSNFNYSNFTLNSTDLSHVNFQYAGLSNSSFQNANLTGVDLTGAYLDGADLTGANPEEANSLEGANMFGVKGLTEEQITACEAKGATIKQPPAAPDTKGETK